WTSVPRPPHQLLEQTVQRGLRVLGHARVHLGGLDDRAARRDQPVKPRALRQRADGAGLAAAFADLRDGLQVALDHGQIDSRREELQALAIELDARAEEAARRAEEDHAGVEELA